MTRAQRPRTNDGRKTGGGSVSSLVLTKRPCVSADSTSGSRAALGLEPFCADVISRLQRQIAESLAPRCLAEDLHAANCLVFTIILAAGLGFSLLLGVILVPLTIRATLTQDFVPAFNLRGSSGSWREILLLSFFAKTHLDKQLYGLYLRRGGEGIPRSAKLIDAPPELPTG